MGSGEFWYRGITQALQNLFSKTAIDREIRIDIFIDGLPLFESSNDEFWPILMGIPDIPHIRPLVIGIYHGKGKPPSAESYLRELVTELNYVLRNGVEMKSGAKFSLKMHAFLGDAPARHFMKCTKGHTGYSSCTKCEVIGEYDTKGRHVSFSRLDCPLRTHEDFIRKKDEDHHLYNVQTSQFIKSPLEDVVGIDMIKHFPVSDSMHLLELGEFIEQRFCRKITTSIKLGVMKRCLKGWIQGSYNFRTKFNASDIQLISNWLQMSNQFFPSETTRSVRPLNTISYWKSIEFRHFLLYFGPVVLKGILSEEAYVHFLHLSLASSIFGCQKYVDNQKIRAVGAKLLKTFVETFKDLYGDDSISYNVHNLIHVAADVEEYGLLSNISAYPYESTLYRIKRLLKGTLTHTFVFIIINFHVFNILRWL